MPQNIPLKTQKDYDGSVSSLKSNNTGKAGIEIGEALLQLGLISQTQLELVKTESVNTGQTVEQVLRRMNLAGEEDLMRAWGIVFGMKYVNLAETTVSSEILHRIPERIAKNYQMVAFGDRDGRLQVALANPRNIQALEALEFIKEQNDQKVDVSLSSAESINYILEQYGTLKLEVTRALEEAAPVELSEGEAIEEDVKNTEELSKVIQEAPISKVVALCIRYAVKSGASDIHIEPTDNELIIRYRIDGVLQQLIALPKHVHPAVVSRIKILSNLKIDEQRLPQDGRFYTKVDDKPIDFRVSTFPTVNGEKVVMRILDKSTGLMSLEQLGVIGQGFKIIDENIHKSHGMILITGPTGSGKSTTIYAIIDRINHVGINIVTVEDPAEYHISGINQSQIKPEIGYTFASGLRSILRQDPDVIMVGEIRDTETAEMAVHSALTGHVVLSTLHTNDAAGAIPRLIDMHIEPFLISSSVNVIIAQRLVRKLCLKCRVEAKPNLSEEKEIISEIEKMPKEAKTNIDIKKIKIFKSKGCDKCTDGYKGRIGIFEVLSVDQNIEPLILSRTSDKVLEKTAIENGMVTLKQDGILKILDGLTTLEEVLKVTRD